MGGRSGSRYHDPWGDLWSTVVEVTWPMVVARLWVGLVYRLIRSLTAAGIAVRATPIGRAGSRSRESQWIRKRLKGLASPAGNRIMRDTRGVSNFSTRIAFAGFGANASGLRLRGRRYRAPTRAQPRAGGAGVDSPADHRGRRVRDGGVVSAFKRSRRRRPELRRGLLRTRCWPPSRVR